MKFVRTSVRKSRSLKDFNVCYLVDDNWDDYGYKTLFHVIYFDGEGVRSDIGDTKIMSRSMEPGHVELKNRFRKLGAKFASLGQTQQFYENLIQLENNAGRDILIALNDVAWNDIQLGAFKRETAFSVSLMR